MGPEVTRTKISAKSANGIFGISVSRGSRKIIICHVFGQENLPSSVLRKFFVATVHNN